MNKWKVFQFIALSLMLGMSTGCSWIFGEDEEVIVEPTTPAPAEPAETAPAKPAEPAGPQVGGTTGSIERLDARLDDLISADAPINVLAEGHKWTEGPVWIGTGGYLLYSDIPNNSIYKYVEGEGSSLWIKPSGFTGDLGRGGESGSNGLLLDPEGRLILCQHGDRRVASLDSPISSPEAKYFTIASKYDGKRLNSPNDAAFHPVTGDLYFTDPPYGLQGGMNDPDKQLDFQGVYRIDKSSGELSLLTDELSRPNGIGFSPDGKTLYVANSDPNKAIWMAYDVNDDGSIANGRVFFDATKWVGERPGLPDGLKVDTNGNIFATGPGGVLIFAADGTHLGSVLTGQKTANCGFGGDGSTLYLTAHYFLMKVETKATGLSFASYLTGGQSKVGR